MARMFSVLLVVLLFAVYTEAAQLNTATSLSQKGRIVYDDSLLAANTGTDTLRINGYSTRTPTITQMVVQVLVDSINTSVGVEVYGSLDGTNFFNLDVTGITNSYTSNGTYAMHYSGMSAIMYVYVKFADEVGGTRARLYIKIKFG